MITDRYGLAVSTASSAARDAYVEGADLLLTAYPGAVEAFERAIAFDPGFALAHVARARALQVQGDIAGTKSAMTAATAVAGGLSEREASHAAFFGRIIAGETQAALAALRAHLDSWPRDAMVLSTCVSPSGLIGVSGRADQKREQAELMDSLAPAYGDDWWFNSHYAIALAENQQRDAARPRIERSMEQRPNNAWGAHWRAHVCYEDGALEAARDFIAAWLPDYPREGVLHGHISWHLAICEIAAGNITEALRIYADSVAPGVHSGAAQSMVADSVSFLWRSELAGQPHDAVGWRAAHDLARRMFPRPGNAFADTHVALADAIVGDGAALEERIRQMEDLARDGRYPSGPVVPALARAFAAFQRRDFSAAIDAIEPVLDQRERISGSRAQTDIVEFTLLKAYLQADRPDDARRLLGRRRPGPSGIPVAGVPAILAHSSATSTA
jgi:tetratricopeptide (TPR) repeat protein